MERFVVVPKEGVGSNAIKGATAVETSRRGVASIWPSAQRRSILGVQRLIQEWLDVTDETARQLLA